MAERVKAVRLAASGGLQQAYVTERERRACNDAANLGDPEEIASHGAEYASGQVSL